jgi:hypothetical protein
MPALFQCSSIAMIFTLMSSGCQAGRRRYQRTWRAAKLRINCFNADLLAR